MDVLVTGGAGFIGGHLAEACIAAGHDVTILDNLDAYYSPRIKHRTIDRCRGRAADGRGSYAFVEGDVRDERLVDTMVGDAEFVFHQAAQAGVRASVENPRKPNAVNVDGTLNVLEAARKHDVERVVLASSSSVYGSAESLPYDERHPTKPVSPYGVSKLAAEAYARVYADVYGLPTVSLRYFTVYGPRMRPNMAISNFVTRCLAGEPPVVYGDGSQTRDFTYIDDVVAANMTLLETDAADGEALNIGSTDTIHIRTLATVVRDLLAPSLDIRFSERRDGDAEHTHADVSKARKLIDYEPSVGIEEGVERFVDWYRSNRSWYEPTLRELDV